MERYELLDDPARFADAVAGLDDRSAWSLDTEFVRERTYFARLCLVQLAVAGRVLLIDPLRLEDPAPLRSVLAAARARKIFHAARQDLEVLLPLTGQPLTPLFDTQIAAALLGFPPQIGYADLVRQLLDVELAKGQARTDWAARPLRPEQLAYAADDVRYLGPVAEELEARLSAAGRLGWLEEECRPLAEAALYRTEPAEAWRRFKGIERMRPDERAVLQALAAWREERAIQKDLPRGWVLTDDALRELARQQPTHQAALQRVDALPGAVAARRGGELLDLIRQARSEAAPGPEPAAAERLTPEQQRDLKRLQELVQQTATELGVSPEVLATRRDLTALLRGARELPPLSGWRLAVVGEKLRAAVS